MLLGVLCTTPAFITFTYTLGLNAPSDFRCGKSRMVDCFLGCDLVEWLQRVGLAQDLGEAVLYGTRLQQGGVLQHIKQEHKFQDSHLYYRFMS